MTSSLITSIKSLFLWHTTSKNHTLYFFNQALNLHKIGYCFWCLKLSLLILNYWGKKIKTQLLALIWFSSRKGNEENPYNWSFINKFIFWHLKFEVQLFMDWSQSRSTLSGSSVFACYQVLYTIYTWNLSLVVAIFLYQVIRKIFSPNIICSIFSNFFFSIYH